MVTHVIGYPMVNLGNLYIDGLQLSWIDNTHILVNAGAARDGTNQDDIVLLAQTSVNIGTNGLNGLDIGTVAPSTAYAVYLIGSSLSANPETNVATQVQGAAQTVVPTPMWSVDNNPQPGIILSTNFFQPNLPFGYDMSRRIGSIATDGASHILPFTIVGNSASRIVYLQAGIQVLNAGASAVFAPVDLSTAVPVGVAGPDGLANIIFDAILTPTAAGNTAALRPTGSASVNGVTIISGPVAGVATELTVTSPAAVSAGHLSIDYKVNTGTLTLNVIGYYENL